MIIPFLTLPYPQIDPILCKMGSFDLRWYGLMYVTGIVLGWGYGKRLIKKYNLTISIQTFYDLIPYCVAGIIIGGRLGYVLFYDLPHFIQQSLEIFYTWKGGMSFHGGLLGVISSVIIFSRIKKISPMLLADLLASIAPVGLFFGRIGNFINGEHFGRFTESPLGMFFPRGGGFPRHPSQLYEAGLEGIILFLILMMAWRIDSIRKIPGRLFALFLTGYGLFRFLVEYVRDPDGYIGFLTIGQALSIPLVIGGLTLFFFKKRAEQ